MNHRLKFFCFLLVSLELTGCKLLDMRNSEITLPAVPMMGVRSQGKSLGLSMGAGLTSHDQIPIYAEAETNPPVKETSGNLTSVGRVYAAVSLGVLDSIDIGCANNRCFWLWDISRIWNLDRWVISVSLARSFELTTIAYSENEDRWSRGDFSMLSQSLNVGYQWSEETLFYGSLIRNQGELVTVIHQSATDAELSRFRESTQGFQWVGGYEHQAPCRLIGVSGCFHRLEAALTEQPAVGFEGNQVTPGLGFILGVRW